jgi:8-amino-7-oxononanoate synthase
MITSGDAGQSVRDGITNVFICVEGVYSMDGDVADLKNVVRRVDEHLPAGNGFIIVDEAHSTGVLGERGRGLVSECGLEDEIWCRVLGFGKGVGCAGGTSFDFHFTWQTRKVSTEKIELSPHVSTSSKRVVV